MYLFFWLCVSLYVWLYAFDNGWIWVFFDLSIKNIFIFIEMWQENMKNLIFFFLGGGRCYVFVSIRVRFKLIDGKEMNTREIVCFDSIFL